MSNHYKPSPAGTSLKTLKTPPLALQPPGTPPTSPVPPPTTLTGVLLVGDGLALGGQGVLEDLHSVLHHLALQAHLQRVAARRHILGQQEAGLGPQPAAEGSGLLWAQP